MLTNVAGEQEYYEDENGVMRSRYVTSFEFVEDGVSHFGLRTAEWNDESVRHNPPTYEVFGNPQLAPTIAKLFEKRYSK